MAWSDVANKIKFFGSEDDGLDGLPATVNGLAPYGGAFSNSTEKGDILAALKDLYDNSASARTLLDSGSDDIWLMKSTNGSFSATGSRTTAIDLNEATRFSWMGNDGRFQTDNLGGNVIHELIHAITGIHDLLDPATGARLTLDDKRDYNNPNFDFLGQAVRLQNQIFQERDFGPGYSQVGYEATFDTSSDTFRKDISYTEDQSIDIAYFDNNKNLTPDILDLSRRTDNSNDLIVGLSGADRINGGAGRDYLYGGVGDDTISGGSGDDVIHGGDRRTAIADDGEDTADYSIGDGQLSPTHGVTVKIDSAAASGADKMDGLTPIVVSDDGYGGRDRLFSIEKLKLSDHRDKVQIGADSNDLLRSLKEIDAGGQDSGTKDTLDLSAETGGLNLIDGKLVGDGVNIEIKNFEEVIGSSSNDTLDVSGTSVTKIEGGAGDDIIVGGDSYSILLGGDGNDQLTAGSGGATLDGGIDDNTYTGGAGADTFIIGSGTHAREGWDVGASFTINNAGANDRLVLRLANAAGIGSDPDLTKGIVLNGGLQLDGQSGGLFSTIPVEPIIEPMFPGDETRTVTGTTLGPVTSELGNLVIGYNWDQENSILDIDIISNFNEYSVRVNGFQEGQLGIHFTHPQLDQIKYYIGIPDPQPIQDTWDAFNSAMQQVVANPEIVDIASPGDPLDIVGSTATPSPDGTSLTPRFDVEEGGDNFAAPSLNGLKFDSQIAQLVSAMATYSPPGADFDSASFGLHMIPNEINPQNALAAAWHN